MHECAFGTEEESSRTGYSEWEAARCTEGSTRAADTFKTISAGVRVCVFSLDTRGTPEDNLPGLVLPPPCGFQKTEVGSPSHNPLYHLKPSRLL